MKLASLLAFWLFLSTAGLNGQHGSPAQEPPAAGGGHHAWTILVLFSEDALQPATKAMEDGIVDAVADLNQAESPRLFFEYLDATRPTRDRCPDDVMADLLRKKYAGRGVDVVIPVGEGAIAFAEHRRQALWQNVPILFVATHNTRLAPATALPDASGLVFRFTFSDALAIARTTVPDTRHVAVISGSSELEQDRTAGYAAEVRRAGLDFIDLSGLRLHDVLHRVGRLPPHTIVFFAGPLVDADGERSTAWKLCETISAASNSPTFTTAASQLLGCGTMGGQMRDFRAVGRRVGERAVAMRAAAGRRVDVIPAAQFTSVVFDARQLHRWQIADRNLPPGSTVAYRPFSRWASYRTPVVVGAVTVSAQLLLMLAFFWVRPGAAAAAEHEPTPGERHAGVVARELIAPLGALQLNVEATDRLLAREPVRLDEVREIVHDLRTLSERSREILVRHGALRRSSAVRAQRLNVGTLIRDSLNRVPEPLRQRVEVTVDEAASQATIVADVTLLVQALANIVTAAADFGPHEADGLRVNLRAGREGRRAVIAIPAAVNRAAIDADPFDVLVCSRTFDVAIGLLGARDAIEAHAGTLDADRRSPTEIAVHVALELID